MNSFDPVADRFELYRTLPSEVLVAIRHALHRHAEIGPDDRLLEVGCGTGRIGAQFNSAGDHYVGIDLSAEMLREFHRKEFVRRPILVHGDGCVMPFRDLTFKAVLMMHVLAAGNWRGLVQESQRVLQRDGLLAIGNSQTQSDGIDAMMRMRLAELLTGLGIGEPSPDRATMNEWLHARSSRERTIIAAQWNRSRTPREFLLRKRSAARFVSLPAEVRETSLRALADWTEQTIGPLDTPINETQSFCLGLHWL